MCDIRLIERKLFRHLARFQRNVSAQHIGKLESRLGRRDMEVQRIKFMMTTKKSRQHPRGHAPVGAQVSGNFSSAGGATLARVAEPGELDWNLDLQHESSTHAGKRVGDKEDASLLSHFDELFTNQQYSKVALEELQDILKVLWNECLSISNDEQHALSLAQQLGQEGVSSLL